VRKHRNGSGKKRLKTVKKMIVGEKKDQDQDHLEDTIKEDARTVVTPDLRRGTTGKVSTNQGNIETGETGVVQVLQLVITTGDEMTAVMIDTILTDVMTVIPVMTTDVVDSK
jgi:hypothetical protein